MGTTLGTASRDHTAHGWSERPSGCASAGAGGLGKSLLAEEYALRFGAAYPGGIYWLRAYGSHEDGPPTTFEELAAEHDRQVLAIADRLGLLVADRRPDAILGALAVTLEKRGQPCLWVVDDLPDGLDASHIEYLLAPHPLASTLLTTRSRRYEYLPKLDLDVLPSDEALDLLTRHRPARTDQERTDAARLVGDLGYHALAIDVAGAALRIQAGLGSFAEFRAALRKTSHDELVLAAKLAKALPGGHQASIAATLRRSMRRLGPAGSDILRLAAALAAAPLPAGLIAAVLQHADGLDDHAAKEQATHGFAEVENLSLASPTGSSADPEVAREQPVEGGWEVHALVARTMRFTDPRHERTAALRAAAVDVLTRALQGIVDARAHITLQSMVPHARELSRHPETAAEADLLGWVARYESQRGNYRPAELAYRQQWDIRQRLFGADHRDTLQSMNNLAATLANLGKLSAARELHQQALEGRQRLFGADHPDTLVSMHNLAETLRHLGELAAARELHQQALDGRQRVLGAGHPDTLQSMNNLAATLADPGELAAARELLEQAVATLQRILGPGHPTTRAAAANLASVMEAPGTAPSSPD